MFPLIRADLSTNISDLTEVAESLYQLAEAFAQVGNDKVSEEIGAASMLILKATLSIKLSSPIGLTPEEVQVLSIL